MSYPKATPKSKHDIVCVGEYPEKPLVSFGSATGFLQRLNDEHLNSGARKISAVYSYPDAPYPPLSRSLIVLGIANRKFLGLSDDDQLPSCLHKCTIAVQLADAQHIHRLESRHQQNSKDFSRFMKQLRKDEAIAIVAKDKHGRFAMVVPMGEPSSADDDLSIIAPEDCAALCYVGEVNEVMEYLSTSAAQSSEASALLKTDTKEMMWKPPGTETSPPETEIGLWQPPDPGEPMGFSEPWATNEVKDGMSSAWDSAAPAVVAAGEDPEWGVGRNKRSFDRMNGGQQDDDHESHGGDAFHADSSAAAADVFYSGLTRSLDTRADSYLFHMRAFNGWVKATQIQELDPVISINGKPQPKAPLRILDLACGKGGDLTKWSLHGRGIHSYVGIDVARGSLKDAAIRARDMYKRNKLSHAIFTVADLGADVPGRKRSPRHKQMQKLLTWSLQDEAPNESSPPEFTMRRGGGIKEDQRFDVVSIQFAIHYMFSTPKRAQRFFRTVSELLEVGGNLICTTIDARVVIEHLMGLGLDYHFDESMGRPPFSEALVEVGAGACQIKFDPAVVRKILCSDSAEGVVDDLYGLQYTFTLVEGSDHAAGVGDAVNLPEWLVPLPVLETLAREAGLELQYAQNFHEFYDDRKDAAANPAAHLALYNMKVLNREGSISADEWSVSRLYAAIKFRKVREPPATVDDTDKDGVESDDDEEIEVELDPVKAKKMLPMAMIQAKRAAGDDVWNALSSEEKKHLTQLQLKVLAKK